MGPIAKLLVALAMLGRPELAGAQGEPASLLTFVHDQATSQAEKGAMARLLRDHNVQWAVRVEIHREALGQDAFLVDLSDRQVLVRGAVLPRSQKDMTHWAGHVVEDNGPKIMMGPPRFPEVDFTSMDSGSFGGRLSYGEFVYQVSSLSPGKNILLKRRLVLAETDIVRPPPNADEPGVYDRPKRSGF